MMDDSELTTEHCSKVKDDEKSIKNQNIWEFYKKSLCGIHNVDEVLDIFWKDSAQYRECVMYAYNQLNKRRPAYGVSHDWNASRSAMSMHMDSFESAFWNFYRNPTKEGAERFSDAYRDMYPAYRMAFTAMFNSELTEHWSKVKDDVYAELNVRIGKDEGK